MPRILPWMMDRESTITPSKRRVAPPKLPQKRAKLSEIESDSANESVQALSTTHRKQDCVGGTSPSSPAPERPMESFMHEGMDNDDQYRMVEDEFLATAQRFTVHLHAAEYKRQEKMVRARNAETISSISRPVTQKMPDHTKRKVEGITRTKIQQEAIQTLFGSKTSPADEQEDSSDDEELAYFNTTLRGLMDSPRRKAESLSKLQCDVATRAAAGFQRPASQHRQDLNQAQESPQPKSSFRLGRSSNPVQESLERLSDLDDDLDAPVPASRFAAVKKRPLPSVISHSLSPSQIDEQDSSDVRKPTAAQRPPYSESPRQSINGTSTLHATQASSNNDASTVRRRLFKSRRDESKTEKGTKDDQDLNLIPTFL